MRKGHINLACIEGIIQELAPGCLTEFHRHHPDVTFTVEAAAPDGVVAALQVGAADLGIFFGLHCQNSVEVLLSYDAPLCVLVAPTHPLAAFKRLSPREVTAHAVVMPNKMFGARRVLDSLLVRADVEMPLLLTTNSIDLTLRMVRSGEAATLMGRFKVRAELEGGSLVAVPLAESELVSGALLVCKSANRPLSLPARQLVGYVERSFAPFR